MGSLSQQGMAALPTLKSMTVLRGSTVTLRPTNYVDVAILAVGTMATRYSSLLSSM